MAILPTTMSMQNAIDRAKRHGWYEVPCPWHFGATLYRHGCEYGIRIHLRNGRVAISIL